MRKLIALVAAATLVAGGLAAPAAAQQRAPRGSEQQQRPPRGNEQRPPRANEQRPQQQRPQQQQQRTPSPSRGDQASARQEMQAGRTMPSREIERRIVPQMKGSDYLGFEYDSDVSAYRLKFIRDGHVTWVDVDARTGRVLRVSK